MLTSVIEEAVVVPFVLEWQDCIVDELVNFGDMSLELWGYLEIHCGGHIF
jgi:hypothetical protein